MTGLMHIIGYPLGWVMWAAYKVIPVYSVAIIIFTVIARLVMLPMSVKQQKNTAHAALFRPKVDAINKKYANNKQKAQEEINKLYEREGYNPFGGCSSLAIQLPLIYGLIDVIYRPMTHLLRLSKDVIEAARVALVNAGVDIVGKRAGMDTEIRILEAAAKNKDILVKAIGQTDYDKMMSLDLDMFGINLGKTPTWAWNLLLLIPILSVITAVLSSFITMKMSDQPEQGKGCTYGMIFGMPLLSGYFAFLVPAGVGFYWIISNIVSCIQSVILKKIYTPEKIQKLLEKDKAKGKTAKKSKLMQKMMEAQEAAAMQQGGASDKEKELSAEEKRARAESEKAKELSDSEKLAAARKRYAEKYGDEYKD